MANLEPSLNENIGQDALKVWMDFWEMNGKARVDIVRRVASNGDPALMIPPDMAETAISAVPVIVVDRDTGTIPDGSGNIPVDRVKLEMIDRVHHSDHLRTPQAVYAIDSILEKDMGTFLIWLVQAHKI
jgi:hypothetical protein